MTNSYPGGQRRDPGTETVPDPPPPKKSPQEQLDAVDSQIANLEERREELLHEVAKEEARQDYDFLEEIHKDCVAKEEVEEEVREAREEANEEAWQLLREFGSHLATCLSGALVGSQKLQPLCTCGWNEVATRLERE